MGSKERWLSYSIIFKTEVMNYAEKTWKLGSWKAFWLTSNREDMRMEEAKERLIKADKSKKLYIHVLLNG